MRPRRRRPSPLPAAARRTGADRPRASSGRATDPGPLPGLIKLQRDLQAVKLLIIDELGYVPLSSTGGGTVVRGVQRAPRARLNIVISNFPFEEWTSVLWSKRLTGALLGRLTRHVLILTMDGDSYRLAQFTARRRLSANANQHVDPEQIDPETGEIPTRGRERRTHPDRTSTT